MTEYISMFANLKEIQPSNLITFCIKEMWVMKIGEIQGKITVIFNQEDLPDLFPNEFAELVAEILCESGYLDKFYERKR